MKNFLSLLPLLALLVLGTGCSKKTTDAATADGGIDWAARAKQYKDNPDALRQLVENCEATEDQLAAARRELSTYQSQSGNSSQQLAAAQAQAQAAQEEINQLRQQLATMAAAKNDQVDTDRAVVQGVIFQVQLGAFAQNTMNSDAATGDALELQDQNGLQKVVVSQFRTYANAAVLRDRLRQMGAKGAFIVAKNNGQRIDVAQALRMTGQG